MDKISLVEGTGVPLRRSNVDTDQIIPAEFLKRVTKTGYDDALFYAWRQDPTFVLNTEPYTHGGVLVAGPDFGTGSSRETHLVSPAVAAATAIKGTLASPSDVGAHSEVGA